MDSLASGGAARPSSLRPLYAVLAVYAAIFLVYSQTWAFTLDEGYHLLAAQLIARGRSPYVDFCFPQTPLNAYWNALWMSLGGAWRLPHLWAALFTIAAVALVAGYVARRFPVEGWGGAAAIVAALGIGLNGPVFVYGPLQAYGICLLGLVAGFRGALRAVERHGWLAGAVAGLGVGIAAASSLLTAAAVPVLGVWIAIFNRAGARWKKLVAFALGLALPFAPVLWLFVRAPRQTWFNLVRYHAFYRSLYWPDTTRHDLEILTSWIDSGQALLLGLGAATGLIWVVRRSGWERAVKAEIYLCAALAGALAAEVGSAHPTFSRYFLVTVPFLAILAAAGWFAACRAFGTTRPLWPAIAVAALLALGLGRTLYDRREMDNWANYERVAAFIDRITPPGEPVLTVEPVYVLTRRIPPPGYELSYTHRVKLPPKEAALMHILHDGAVARQVQSGLFATVYTCDAGDIKDYGLKALYRQHVELEECDIFWDRVK